MCRTGSPTTSRAAGELSDVPRPHDHRRVGLRSALGASAAALLARDCEITVLRVTGYHVPVALGAETVPLVPDPVVVEETERAEEREARGDVDALRAELAQPAEPRIERGDPAVVICDVAGEGNFNLVVVGSHGHGLLKRMVIGSVSNHVLRHARCPVLVVREQDPPEC